MPMQRIKNLEEQHDLQNLIPTLVNRHGQAQTGKMLGVCAATINKWLKDNGYVKQIQYVKVEKKH